MNSEKLIPDNPNAESTSVKVIRKTIPEFDVNEILNLLYFEFMKNAHYVERGRLKIYMPQYIRFYFRDQMIEKTHIPQESIERFRGIEIVTGYENKIVIAYDQVTLFPEPWMIIKYPMP